MGTVYGYARVSTKHQQVERQVDSILKAFPNAEIKTEKFTGTTLDRPVWSKLFKEAAAGDTIVFDEVSRMSRNAAEGFAAYQALFDRGVELVFLKDPHLNTSVFRETLNGKVELSGTEIDCILQGINQYLMILARKQIEKSFEAAQIEVEHLHTRVADGMSKKGAGAKIAKARTGKTYETKKSKEMKAHIRKLSKDFDGTLKDVEVMQYLQIARNSYYKYKRQMQKESEGC